MRPAENATTQRGQCAAAPTHLAVVWLCNTFLFFFFFFFFFFLLSFFSFAWPSSPRDSLEVATVSVFEVSTRPELKLGFVQRSPQPEAFFRLTGALAQTGLET